VLENSSGNGATRDETGAKRGFLPELLRNFLMIHASCRFCRRSGGEVGIVSRAHCGAAKPYGARLNRAMKGHRQQTW